MGKTLIPINTPITKSGALELSVQVARGYIKAHSQMCKYVNVTDRWSGGCAHQSTDGETACGSGPATHHTWPAPR